MRQGSTRNTRKTLWRIAFLAGALAALLWTAVAMAEQPGWGVRVLNAAAVAGPVVRLGDIAEPVGNVPPGVWEELSQAELFASPTREGRVETFSRSRLRNTLRYYMGERSQGFALPQQFALQRGGTALTAEQVQRLVVAFLTPRAAALEGDAEFREYRLPPYIFLGSSQDTLEISLSRELEAGRVLLQFVVSEPGGQVVRRLSGTVFMDLWRAVPCPSQSLRRGEVLSPENLTFVRKNLAYLQDAWDGRGGPWRMTRSLGPTQPILQDYIEPVPLVQEGEEVTLVYRGPRVRLAVPAEAQADAGMGETVSVRNLQSSREVLAVVVGRNTVEVR